MPRLLPLLLIFCAAGACVSIPATNATGPLFFEVEFLTNPSGLDPAFPGTFSTTAVDYPIRITAPWLRATSSRRWFS